MTPIMLWRWELLPGKDGHVYHAVQPIHRRAGEGDVATWVAACHGTGMVSVLEVDKTERCLACIKYLARPEE